MGLTACPNDVTDDGGAGGQGGGPTEDGGAGGGDGGGALVGRGGVSIGNRIGSQGVTSTVIGGYVLAQPGECLPQQISGCTLSNCQAIEPVFVDAGTIEVTGGNAPLTLQSENNVYLAVPTDVAFEPGQNLHIVVSGATVPAHSFDLTGPAVFDVTVPNLAALVVDRASDLHIEWTPVAGTAVIGIYSEGTSLTCQVDATTGAYDLPADLLGQLPVGKTASFYASNWDLATLTVEGWELQATSYSDATSASSPTGAATTPITLQ